MTESRDDAVHRMRLAGATYKAIGEHFGISPQRARQIEIGGFRKRRLRLHAYPLPYDNPIAPTCRADYRIAEPCTVQGCIDSLSEIAR